MLNTTNIVGLMNKVSCRIFKKKKQVLNSVFASIVAMTLAVSSAHANPTGGNVVAGSATINDSGNTTTINQSSNKRSKCGQS